jgi:NAD+ synthase (glutamine-hydrolysing)
MIASNGELLESSPRFSYADFTLTTMVDIETNRPHSYIKSPITDGGWKVSVPFKFSDDVAPIPPSRIGSFEAVI